MDKTLVGADLERSGSKCFFNKLQSGLVLFLHADIPLMLQSQAYLKKLITPLYGHLVNVTGNDTVPVNYNEQ